jgi:hypothetical protein
VAKVVHSGFLAFFFAGSLSAAYLLASFIPRVVAARFWPEVECVVETSRGAVNPQGTKTFAIEIEYRYLAEGKPRTGTRWRRDHPGTDDYSEAARVALRFPAGAQATCRVNPRDPDEAVLECDSLLVPVALLLVMASTLLVARSKGWSVRPSSGCSRRGKKRNALSQVHWMSTRPSPLLTSAST